MRVLICTGEAGGNVPPVVAIARELVKRGHAVRLLAGPWYPGAPRSEPMEAAFLGAGCEVISPKPETWMDGVGVMPDLNAIPDHFLLLKTVALWTPMSLPWANATRFEIEAFDPTVVLVDLVAPGAGMAAEVAGVSRVVVVTTVPVHRSLPGLPLPGRGAPPGDDPTALQDEFTASCKGIMEPMNAARERVGLSRDEAPWSWEDRADRVLVLSSPEFDFAFQHPANMVYTGTVRSPQPGHGWDNPWDSRDERPLVVVSGTTTGLSGLWFAVFRAAANAIVDLGMRGIITTGTLDPASLPQHESLAYRNFVPHSEVLPSAAAMVTQCGHGATVAALRHGVPMVCAPVFFDQIDIAARVEYHGAGIGLTTMSSAEEFREAIEAVVTDTRYREAARGLAEKLKDDDGAVRAADEIEAVASG